MQTTMQTDMITAILCLDCTSDSSPSVLFVTAATPHICTLTNLSHNNARNARILSVNSVSVNRSEIRDGQSWSGQRS